MNRPIFCTDEHLEYLDNLRESGKTNMWGAAPYLIGAYLSLTKKESQDILIYWIESFGKEDR